MCKQCIKTDARYASAKKLALEGEPLTPVRFQKTMSIGYNRAVHLIDALQHDGVITEPNAEGRRELVTL